MGEDDEESRVVVRVPILHTESMSMDVPDEGSSAIAEASIYLHGGQTRAHWMRLDTAEILKRFFFCERSLLLSEAAWLPYIGSIPIKTELPRFIWESSLTAGELRERVFELRYPSRLMHVDRDAGLVSVFDAVRDAPSVGAFFLAVSNVLLPMIVSAYREYAALSDHLADGPTLHFLSIALDERQVQTKQMSEWADFLLQESPDEIAEPWAAALAERLAAFGGIPVDRPMPDVRFDEPVPGSRPYSIPDQPARDHRFYLSRFYWPDNVDPEYPYGEGVALQLRSAVSHLNEAWAVETAGVILAAFADLLPFEWIRDAARWTYDEARHCRMGYERLLNWGFEPAQIPLGTYIYDSAAGQDPIYRLAFLFYFETLNIGKKTARARLFHEYGDSVSEHDMDFDWADETIHASYGKRWLQAVLEARGEDPERYEQLRKECGQLVAACVATATPGEKADLEEVAQTLIELSRTRS
jgi:uncharacterized ferritin-like protein (DUF455 family)